MQLPCDLDGNTFHSLTLWSVSPMKPNKIDRHNMWDLMKSKLEQKTASKMCHLWCTCLQYGWFWCLPLPAYRKFIIHLNWWTTSKPKSSSSSKIPTTNQVNEHIMAMSQWHNSKTNLTFFLNGFIFLFKKKKEKRTSYAT